MLHIALILPMLQDFMISQNNLSGAFPDAAAWPLIRTEKIWAYCNGLSGPVPDAVASWKGLRKLSLSENQLSGVIPSAVAAFTQVEEFSISWNQVSGRIPDAVGAWRRLQHGMLKRNKLTGSLPSDLCSLARLQDIFLSDNKLSGPIPEAFAASTHPKSHWQSLYLENNRLSGSIPAAVATLKRLVAFKAITNRLSGPIPEALGDMSKMRILEIGDNKLSGTIPGALGSAMPKNFGQAKAIHLFSNALSGSIPDRMCQSAVDVDVHENDLTGTLPHSIDNGWLQTFSSVRNMLEGQIPRIGTPYLSRLVIASRRDAGTAGLSGGLPASLSRSTPLQFLVVAHQHLEGVIPQVKGTWDLLALHANRFDVLSGARFSNSDDPEYSSKILLLDNRLSCPLPCGDVPPNLGVIAVGNQLRKPSKSFPPWALHIERDKLLWTSGREGRDLLMMMTGAVMVMAVAVLHGRRVLRIPAGLSWLHILSRLHDRHGVFADMCFQLISCFWRASLAQAVFLMLLLHWDTYYRCPRTLVLLSACARSSRMIEVLVLCCWCHFGFYSSAVQCMTTATTSSFGLPQQLRVGTREHCGRLLRTSRLWIAWLLVVGVLDGRKRMLKKPYTCVSKRSHFKNASVSVKHW